MSDVFMRIPSGREKLSSFSARDVKAGVGAYCDASSSIAIARPSGCWIPRCCRTETAYLLRNPANAERLLAAIDRARRGEFQQHDLLDA